MNNLTEIFGSAKWLCAGSYNKISQKEPDQAPHFPILRSRFCVSGVKKATLRVIGLGFFYCYINGNKISDDYFLPLSTDFEVRNNHPTDEILTGHRIYVPEYDVTDLLNNGENLIAVHFGGGWYTFEDEPYGDPKVIYRLTVDTDCGTQEFFSSESDRIGDSFVKTYYMPEFEAHDYNGFDDKVFSLDFNDSDWAFAKPAKPLETEYEFCDCPPDRIRETIKPMLLKENPSCKYYDIGKNCSAIPVLKINAKQCETVTVQFAEKCRSDSTLDLHFIHNQRFTVVSDGKGRTVQPLFTWFAHRYVCVEGDAELVKAYAVNTDVKVSSEFTSNNETLNWIYNAFVNTQLSNMHCGIPSDCPSLERRGYTGDGELACHAVMNTLDAQAFYKKWIKDISDCQDTITGHVQYTAPYTRCGGGPGGWGCAIVEVPYRYYKHYGDTAPLFELYPQMLRYFDFLDAHSVNNIVASDKAGEWCLGDWCAPDTVMLPAGFVNNYFYIKSLTEAIEIAKIVGDDDRIPLFEEKIQTLREAVTAAYFNTWEGNFFGGLQGADAFAIDMGVGDERTYKHLVRYYTRFGRYDTGIFGTDVVTRVLFEHGDGELAASLMMSEKPVSFEYMRRGGGTTIWEYWPNGIGERSLNHPMFGAVTAYIFDYILGIRPVSTASGSNIVIAPVLCEQLTDVSGKRTLPTGEISVSYKKCDTRVDFCITVPAGVTAKFILNETEATLSSGENRISVSL